ncbi:MAG: molybdenum cofactor guanylyltransferase [Verrucomicrobiales bacterium]|nr:molybdenum cofactor guanylyltransferase [Verrucomicrobiales bacterium]
MSSVESLGLLRDPVVLSAVILAGGASRRMGKDKAWLDVGGCRLIERQVAVAREVGATEVMISGRPGADYSSLGLPVLLDETPDLGPMSGVKRAFEAMRGTALLVLAVDLPAMTGAVLKELLLGTKPGQGAVPQWETGDLEPLVAVYPAGAREMITDFWTQGRYSMQAFARACAEAGSVALVGIPEADRSFFTNWNRPADFPAGGQPPTR